MRNLTLGIAPSLDDLILLPQRAAERAKQFAYYYGLDDIFGRIKGSGAFIAENTGNRSNVSASLTKQAFAAKTIAAAAYSASNTARASPGPRVAAAATGAGFGTAFSQGLSDGGVGKFFTTMWQAWRNLGGVLPYIMSKWAFVTILMGFLVNRTQFYASSRVPLTLWWPVRLGLFLAPIVAVCVQITWLLEGMRCQTSPDFPQYRYGNASKVFDLDYAGEGGLIYSLGSSLTAWESDLDACVNVGMSNHGGAVPSGSLSLLWPLFLSLCLGAFTDTLSSALQGRPPLSDTNLLELSFAFNEAEAMVVRVFEAALTGEDGSRDFDRKLLIRSTNTSPDMLLIATVWGFSSLTSMVLGIIGKRHQYRLLNTGFWGICYFAALARSIALMWLRASEQEAFWSGRIPMILLMGFVPHFIVVCGMVTCALIYGAALITTAFSLPASAGAPRSLKARLSLAYSNLQANVHFSNATVLGFRMTDDFYTALLNTGFTLLTAASEAVYLNEGAKVRVSNLTWIERKRIQELQQGLLFKRTREAIPTELRAAANDRVEVAVGNPQPSGYGIERKIRGQDREEALAAVKGNSGLQVVERSSRYNMAFRLIVGTFWLVAGFNAKLLLKTLELCGIAWRPRILRRLMGIPKHNVNANGNTRHQQRRRPDLLIFPDKEIMQVGNNPNVDIEAEFKRHSVLDDDNLDDNMYSWWRQGGYWGDIDTSGEYTPGPIDDDATSMISMSTELASNSGDDWEDMDESGRRTPTQYNPFPSSREATPAEFDSALDSEQLARLLDPKSKDEQEEARILAKRLRYGGIMTRSRYNREIVNERAALLASSRYGQRLALSSSGTPLSPEEEEAAIERFIIERRQSASRQSTDNEDWASGAAGMGSAGPQCVVCQDNPRTILLWPCGCLCLCDDCRVNMAARNFGTCVCCRTGTLAYSRLYVP